FAYPSAVRRVNRSACRTDTNPRRPLGLLLPRCRSGGTVADGARRAVPGQRAVRHGVAAGFLSRSRRSSRRSGELSADERNVVGGKDKAIAREAGRSAARSPVPVPGANRAYAAPTVGAASAGSGRPFIAAGSATSKTEPSPTVLSTRISPSWAATIDWQMLSPRPLPHVRSSRRRDLSPR